MADSAALYPKRPAAIDALENPAAVATAPAQRAPKTPAAAALREDKNKPEAKIRPTTADS